jgi:hydrocephalus-inducing protein
VRTPIAKKVTIKNPTAKPWKVKATVNALLPQFREYFEGKEYLEVAPNAQVEYEIIYKPLTMTSNPQAPAIKDEQHEGTLFFPLPDGLAMLYNLIGKSLPPTPIQTIDLAIKAKKSHIQILPIKNWLKSV